MDDLSPSDLKTILHSKRAKYLFKLAAHATNYGDFNWLVRFWNSKTYAGGFPPP